ncbi:MAG: winged helix-turn-helix transcriptional regulator [Sporichthyaceae bacterium]
MGAGYGQFCPVAKAMELLDERWTLLVVRELLAGSTRFGELQRGVPRMSPALLSTRLARLTKAGVVTRTGEGAQVRYGLTPAGRELGPIVEALGSWGIRWAGDLGEKDLDPKLLMWDMNRSVHRHLLPEGRTVVHFRFPEAPKSRVWWMLLEPTGSDVCDFDPGHEVDLVVTADLRGLTEFWLGEQSWAQVVRTEKVSVDGPTALRRALPNWFTRSAVVEVPRPKRRPVAAR